MEPPHAPASVAADPEKQQSATTTTTDEPAGPLPRDDDGAPLDADPVLDAKMRLVNAAIDEIGWTPYHAKLFFLNGFGYAVDSLVLALQSLVADAAYRELGGGGYRNALTVALYAGMLAGAVVWGGGADLLGRRRAFNLSLFLAAACCAAAGAMPSWPALGALGALLGFAAGGNLILDSVVFLEFLPGRHQWLLTALGCWWGVGQAVAALIGWAFLLPRRWNCPAVPATASGAGAAGGAGSELGPACAADDNRGWRYTLFVAGALVLALSVLRVTVVRLRETPKYQLAAGRDGELVEALRLLAETYGRPCSLTVAELEACGGGGGDAGRLRRRRGRHCCSLAAEALGHVRGLFASRVMAVSTLMLWFSWCLIGLAYPLFFVFLPTYLKNRGIEFERPPADRWRNLVLTDLCGAPGPVVAGLLCNTRLLGRRYTMVVGALATAAFFFAYTAVRTAAQDTAMACLIACCIHVYYGTLYAYTPEVLPSAHRGTGNGIAVACNRVMGVVSALVATSADTATPAPIYVCGAMLVAAAVVAALFPLEPYRRRCA